MKFSIIGVPFNGDGTSPEIENPAQAFREEGIISLFRDRGYHVNDNGDLIILSCNNKIDPKTKVLNFDVWCDVSQRLSKKLQDVLDPETFPIILGGDCSILMGIIAAFNNVSIPINLFFLDGHADFNDINTSPTGEPADMELAALTGYLPNEIVDMMGKGPLINEENVIVFGISDYELIEKSNIKVIDINKIKEKGIKNCFDESLNSIKNPSLPIWFHFDVDALDKVIMPAIQYPVKAGLSHLEIKELLSLLMKTGKVTGISIACYHPNLDPDGIGIKELKSLFTELF
ncbi:MAG: arginase family protein [Candidatus Kariarchaeaceae archaeon]|jgi:arginase